MNVYDLIREDEGLRLKVYDDATGEPIGPGSVVRGHPTIAYGRALDRHGVSADEAEHMLFTDVDEWSSQLSRALRWFSRLNEQRKAALISMAHQMGVDGVLAFDNALTAMQAGAWDIASQELLRSRWAKQTPARAGKIAGIIRTGEWPA